MASRRKIACSADYVIPAYGPMFPISELMKDESGCYWAVADQDQQPDSIIVTPETDGFVSSDTSFDFEPKQMKKKDKDEQESKEDKKVEEEA